jgi:PhnB protein
MDFREGGTWLYCMISPKNEVHWCKNDFVKIDPKKSYTGLDAFCDENGVINTELPRTEWTNVFTEENNKTLVSILAKYSSLADLEMIINMGFKEGFTMGLNQLDALLASLKH